MNFFNVNPILCSTYLILGILFFSNQLQANQIVVDSERGKLSLNLHSQVAFFSQSNSWFGQLQNNIGINSTSWLEWAIEPGINGNFILGKSGELFSELSYRYAKTIGDDASGFTRTLNNPGKGLLEQAYFGWRSGKLFSSAKNWMSISIGQQDYTLGQAFLLLSSGSAGYKNGAYWLGGRRAFTDSFLFKLQTDDYLIESFRLKSRPQLGSKKDIRGVNLEWSEHRQQILGFSYPEFKS
jgi:hypothetical protein